MKRHPLDLLSLLLGVVFLIVALAYVAGDLTDAIPSLQIAMPLMLVGLGVAGVVGAVTAQQRSDNTMAPLQYAPVESETYAATGGESVAVSDWSAPPAGVGSTDTPTSDISVRADPVAGDEATAPADTVVIESPDRSTQDTTILGPQAPEHRDQRTPDE